MNLTRARNGQAKGAAERAPLSRLRGEMDSLIDRFFRDPWGGLATPWREGAITPRLDLAETDEDLVLRMELAGVRAEDIDIEVTNHTLTVRGEKWEQKDDKGRDYSYCESEYGTFSRSIDLPPGVDPDHVDAAFADGVLTITLPKRPDAKPRRIPVQGRAPGANGAGQAVPARTTGRPDAEGPAGVRRISREDLASRIASAEPPQVVNVLEPEHHHLGMIPGSLRIPLSQLDRRMGELDKERPVVVYCAGMHCHASRKAAEKLARHGFDVQAYEGGIEEWKGEGLPTQ